MQAAAAMLHHISGLYEDTILKEWTDISASSQYHDAACFDINTSPAPLLPPPPRIHPSIPDVLLVLPVLVLPPKGEWRHGHWGGWEHPGASTHSCTAAEAAADPCLPPDTLLAYTHPGMLSAPLDSGPETPAHLLTTG